VRMLFDWLITGQVLPTPIGWCATWIGAVSC
jgi:hypothetical protein